MLILWVGGTVVCTAVCVVGIMLFLRSRPKKLCRNCRFWDIEAGQALLRRSQTFSAVMQVLTPNDEFGEKVFEETPELDEEGKPVLDADGNPKRLRTVKRLPVYSQLENRWDYFGGCQLDSMLRHRTDTCGKFKAV